MDKQHFIFSSSKWLGEGLIHLNMLDEELSFFTRWHIVKGGSGDAGLIECTQEIQVKGLSDIMMNQFVFFDITSSSFAVTMENYALGKLVGKGFIDHGKIGWEFRIPQTGFEGFEFYQRNEDGSYEVHGEFATQDDLRTKINGKIWKQSVPG